MVGLKVSSTTSYRYRRTRDSRGWNGLPAASSSLRAFKSAPAQNARSPTAVSTTARTVSSEFASTNASISASPSSGEIAFIRSGRLIVRMRMWPRSSVSRISPVSLTLCLLQQSSLPGRGPQRGGRVSKQEFGTTDAHRFTPIECAARNYRCASVCIGGSKFLLAFAARPSPLTARPDPAITAPCQRGRPGQSPTHGTACNARRPQRMPDRTDHTASAAHAVPSARGGGDRRLRRHHQARLHRAEQRARQPASPAASTASAAA